MRRQPMDSLIRCSRSAALVLGLASGACTPDIESRRKDSDAGAEEVATTVTDGAVNAALSASASGTQTVAGVDGAAGASVAFPPGSLALDTTLTVEEGEDLSTSAGDLGLSDVTVASPSVIVGSSESADPLTPFTVSLPISGMALALLQDDPDARLLILHKRIEYATGKTIIGILLRTAITVEGSTASFETSHFGVFQVVYTAALVTETVSAETTDPIVNKTVAATPVHVTFSATAPASPSISTTFAVVGTTALGSRAVYLYSDAECKVQIGVGTASIFASTGISLAITANSKVSVYAVATSLSRPSSACTLLTTIESDTTLPGTPVVTGGGGSITQDTTPTWSWTKPTGASGTYRYKLDNSDFSFGTTETVALTYTPATGLTDGLHTLYVQARDLAGNWSMSGSASIAVDTVAPAVAITNPDPTIPAYLPAKTFTVEGTCEAGLNVDISGTGIVATTVPCFANNTFTAAVEHSGSVAVPALLLSVVVEQTDGVGHNTDVSGDHYYGMPPTGLELWLDDTSHVMSGADIASWEDRATEGSNPINDGTPNTLLTPGTAYGLATVPLSTSEYISIYDDPGSTNLEMAPGSDALSIFVAFKGVNQAATILAKGNAGSGADMAYELSMASSAFNLTLGGTLYSGVVPANDNGATPRVISVVSDPGVTNKVRVFNNANTAYSNTGTMTLAQGSQTGVGLPLYLGARKESLSSPGNFFTGEIYEVIIYSRALLDDERLAIAQYLAEKWGL